MTRHGVVTVDLVARRFFWRANLKQPGIWAAYRRLSALRFLGFVLSDKPFANQPAALRVTRKGAQLADVGIKPAPLVLSELQHTIQLVRLTEYLLFANPGSAVQTEREVRAERYREVQAGTRKTGQGRIPDALLTLSPRARKGDERGKGRGAGGGQLVAVELDLSRKDRRVIEEIVRAYDYENVNGVWWYVKPERVERVAGIIKELRAEDRIEVMPWPE